ncbi:MAG: iron-sulfur cluster assembly protein [Thermoplasmata archaeon]
MPPANPPSTPDDRTTSPAKGPLLGVTPRAVAAARQALEGRSSEDVVRVFVEPGIHPRPAMLIGRSKPDDVRVVAEGVTFVVDPPSVRFLQDATVDFVESGADAGFKVTGPNLAANEVAASNPGAAPVSPPPSGSRGERETALRAALKHIYDPEIPMNIIDLGLIYGIDWAADDRLTIRMTMTSPGCPVIESLANAVKEAAQSVPGVEHAEVDVVWDPPWGPERMSEFAKLQLGFA